ncbi:MAG: BamA/TamA family outer membrane protein [Flavobacteriales bacterium]|nr:BamA/TamA family outer membrane protein [Flavobacteriales bacterium]
MDFYKDSTRVSNAKAEVNYTWNKQLILEGEWNYFTRAEKWYTDGLIHYSRYPDRYYGIGVHTADSNELLFESRRSKLEVSALRSIHKHWFIGPNFRYINYGNISADELIPFRELKDASMFSVGLDLYQDSRNNLLNPKEGTYLRSKILYCNGSNGRYQQFLLDARAYLKLPAQAVLANRMLHRFNGSAVPYFDMSVAGGDDFVRGYFYGRFRDLNLSTLQSEARIPLFWRLGLTVFGGYSYLFKHSLTEQNAAKWNAGGGIRILMDKEQDVNLRLDYAGGENGQSGFYIAFGESF